MVAVFSIVQVVLLIVDYLLFILSIWNKALSEQEINEGLGIVLNGDEDNLVGYYKFNFGEGNILIDHSGNQNHGEINGAEWVENIEGCTDQSGCNYNVIAVIDDGSCTYPLSDDYNCDGSCGGVNNSIEDCLGVCGGTAQDPNIMLDTDFLDFDIIVSEEATQTQTITITNNGDCELELNLNSQNEFNLSFDGIDDYATISNQLDLENDFTMEFVFDLR